MLPLPRLLKHYIYFFNEDINNRRPKGSYSNHPRWNGRRHLSSGLASAVANEGGIGVISAAGLGLLYKKLSPSNYTEAGNLGLAEEIRKAREKAKGIIGVNVMVALSDFAELVKTSIAEKVDIIFSGAGLPLDLPSFLKKDSVTKLVPIVSSARAVRIICEKWKNNYDYLPDAVVLEGPKAGGHLGYKENQLEDQHFSLEELLPQVVEEVSHFEQKYDKKIPVIAAEAFIRVKISNA